MHVSGAIKAAGTSVGIDLSIVSGKGATGTISEGSASFKLVALGDNFYIQPDPAFLEKFAHSSAAVSLLKGKWLTGSRTDGSFASFGQLTSINSLMTSLVKGHGTLTKGSTSTRRRSARDRDPRHQQGRHDVRRDDRQAVSDAGEQDERLQERAR